MLSPLRLALYSVSLLSSTLTCTAAPQSPETTTDKVPSVAPQTNADVPISGVKALVIEGELRLQVQTNDVNVNQLLSEIASQGNLQIVVRTGVTGRLRTINMSPRAPEKALQVICMVASVNCEFQDGVWIISPKGDDNDNQIKTKLIDSLVFKDIDVTELFSIIATQFNVPIALAKDVSGKIPFIRIQNKTPRQAIEIIAKAAGLAVQEQKDGVLIVIKAEKKPVTVNPESSDPIQLTAPV